MSLIVIALLLSVVWLAGGCEEEVILTQELVIDEPLAGAAVTDVEIDMGAGSLTVAPGATGLVAGTIRYNLESWQPTVTRDESSLKIEQGTKADLSGIGDTYVNEWDIQLGKAPIRLKVSAGAYKGSFDLGGLTLEKLTIKDGASESRVSFSTANPGQMQSLEYETGVSSVTLIGLANANFKNMQFKGGAGSYSLDFSGDLRTAGRVKVEAGAGDVELIVPAATPAKVTIGGKLNDVSTQGVWTVVGETYSTTAIGTVGQGKMLTIEVEMNVGSVTLVAK